MFNFVSKMTDPCNGVPHCPWCETWSSAPPHVLSLGIAGVATGSKPPSSSAKVLIKREVQPCMHRSPCDHDQGRY